MTEFTVTIDADHGGRWTRLYDPSGRQWLWERPDLRRNHVRPGDTFVDAGGLEECYPTIGSDPDHGFLWTRPWATRTTGASGELAHEVIVGEVALTRTITADSAAIIADYRLHAPAGTRFIWAAHALLELAVGARILAASGAARAWPDHATPHDTTWPHPLGIDYANLGLNDGSAMFCLLPDRREVEVHDGPDRLRFQLDCPGQPVSVGLWRNLGGYPWIGDEKYRNIGIEPMLGRVFDLNAAGPDDAAVVPASGSLSWRLSIDNG